MIDKKIFHKETDENLNKPQHASLIERWEQDPYGAEVVVEEEEIEKA
jgi:hypothetical protein